MLRLCEPLFTLRLNALPRLGTTSCAISPRARYAKISKALLWSGYAVLIALGVVCFANKCCARTLRKLTEQQQPGTRVTAGGWKRRAVEPARAPV